jgi:hypothetical protein
MNPVSPSARTSSRLWLVIVVAGLFAGPALAQWKWRDANGQITASDRAPPSNVPDKDILQRPEPGVRRVAAAAPAAAPASAASAGAAATKPVTPLAADVEARKRAAEQEAAAKAKAEEARVAKLRAENCGRAQAQARALESGERMARYNAKGEREVIDDATRAAELSAARAVIASDCR